MSRLVCFYYCYYSFIHPLSLIRLKEKLQSGAATDTLPLKLLMDQYQARFEHEKPFGLKEFSTVLMIAFPQSADVQKSISGPAPLIDLVLQNIKYKPEKQPDCKSLCLYYYY